MLQSWKQPQILKCKSTDEHFPDVNAATNSSKQQALAWAEFSQRNNLKRPWFIPFIVHHQRIMQVLDGTAEYLKLHYSQILDFQFNLNKTAY